MNLVPNDVKDTGNYWCTWRTQATVCGHKGLQEVHTNSTRDAIGEEFLFGEIGALNKIDPSYRGDLIVVLDDGWDVPYHLKPDWRDGGNDDLHRFGSFELNNERFASFTGVPQERLKKLNDTVKRLGYRGIGLWVAVQVANRKGSNPDAEAAKPVWMEHLKWCDYAVFNI